MLLRRVAPAALAILALTACEPGVGYDTSRNVATNYAAFDPSATPPQIPLPNDLALTQAGTLPGAQGELLRLFNAAGREDDFQQTSEHLLTLTRALGDQRLLAEAELHYGTSLIRSGAFDDALATLEGAIMLSNLYKDAVHMRRAAQFMRNYVETELKR